MMLLSLGTLLYLYRGEAREFPLWWPSLSTKRVTCLDHQGQRFGTPHCASTVRTYIETLKM
jgi:hypothetical protein